MGLEVANEKWLDEDPDGLLGQFASTRGYSDLIEAAEKHKLAILTEWFSTGVTEEIAEAQIELAVLANARDVDADIKTTASVLRELIEGQNIAIITDGCS